jgi:hypothetical protein
VSKKFSFGIAAYSTGIWNVCGVTKTNPPKEEDRLNGLNSIRLWGRTAGSTSLNMKFNKSGAGVVSINYGSYGNHTGGKFKLQQSINDGTNWTDLGTEITVPAWNGTFLTYSAVVNYNGNIRFRIEMTATTGTNDKINVDNFMATDFGTEQVAMPTSSSPTGIYETAQTVTISSATSGATIYYTTDGTAPTTLSTVYSTLSPLNITTTTKIRAIAVAAGKVDSREEVVLISFPELVDNLAALYTKMAATGTNLTYFKYTGDATVTASYTATYKTLFIQDNSAGILLSDTYRNTTLTNNVGDKITGIYAQVNRVNDSPQLYPYNDFTVISIGNIITPPVVTLADVPNRTNQLVQINDLYFDEANGTKTFGPNTPYIIHDASMATTTTTFRTPSGMPNPDYNATIIPAKRNIICLIAKNNPTATTHYLFARNAADLNVTLSTIKDLTLNSFSISNNKIYFETTTVEKVSVFSVNGQLITTVNSTVGRNSIALNNGIYIIKIGEKAVKVVL